MVKPIIILLLISAPCYAATKSVQIITPSPYEVEDTVLLMLIGANRETTAFDFLSLRRQKDTAKLIGTLKQFENDAEFKLNGKIADFRVLTHATSTIEAAKKLDFLAAGRELWQTNKSLINIRNTLFMTFLFMHDQQSVKGSLEFTYAFPYYVQESNTTVCVVLYVKIIDNQLYIETHLHGKMQSLTHACLKITAVEQGEASTITAVMSATSTRGDRRIGHKVVSKIMTRLLCERLCEFVKQGHDLAAAGQGPTPAIMTKAFIENISKHGLRQQ